MHHNRSRHETAPRLAAFANGLAIHAHDYDDTQLAVGADRVYGLLTHPTAPALPSSLAVADKFRECTQFANWPDDKSEAIIETVRKLEELDNVQELTALLAP